MLTWLACVEHDDVDFDTFRRVPSAFESLDAKIRAAMSQHMAGKDADAIQALVQRITQKRDEVRKAAVPRQITGLQIVDLARSSYRIHDTEHTTFELSTLMSLEYPGDAHKLYSKTNGTTWCATFAPSSPTASYKASS